MPIASTSIAIVLAAGLDNARTVWDGGGNVSNNKTGAGTITIPTL